MDERSYMAGARSALVRMLDLCLQHLGIDDAAAGQARWVVEREEAVAMLRQLCAGHGDNDWPDDLHLADVIDRHLGRYLDAAEHGGRDDVE